MTYEEAKMKLATMEDGRYLALCYETDIGEIAFEAMKEAYVEVHNFERKYDNIIYSSFKELYGNSDWYDTKLTECDKASLIDRITLVTAYYESIIKLTKKFDELLMEHYY